MGNHEAILDVVERYFESIYTGDVAGLRCVFHPAAQVTDNVRGPLRVRPVEEYILGVGSRESPQARGERRTMHAIAVEVLDGVASVTARLDMLDQRYFNVLSLIKQDDQWIIVHKLFGDVAS